ncbi:MAG: hypothetical protein KDA84_19865 [Planctomycetaceae bacterium]|nr:hypothetical protein [Planctomycetaceae bacterium]
MQWRAWRLMGLVASAAIVAWATWQWQPTKVQAEYRSTPQSPTDETSDGQELFHRSWLPDDPRSPNGDGLGPMFNETSCAACHNQGGPGGGGPTSKNVELLTAFFVQPPTPVLPPGVRGNPNPTQKKAINPASQRKLILQTLKVIHPDFEKSSSVVIHRFGTSGKHNQWRTNLLSQSQSFQNVNVSFQNSVPQPFGGSFSPDQNSAARFAGVAASLTDDPLPSAEPPRTEPVPDPSFPSPAQVAQSVFPAVSALGTSSTGIPLVDELVGEMRRLQNETRQDLSKSIHRGQVVLLSSQRNTSALFGAGVIDTIPDEVIEAAAKIQYEDFPRVSGRVHRLPDNKIGRFGWKAQKASLRDFTLAACANELGLDVPEHAQPQVPYEPHQKSKGQDMTANEAAALVSYVRSLPAPIQEMPKDKEAAKIIKQGQELFTSVGCAVCHKQDLGEAKGIYSDLLLHDMGSQLQASGSYGIPLVPEEFDPTADEPEAQTDRGTTGEADPNTTTQTTGRPQPSKLKAATSGEWRTPPLWGLRDSAPYMHDGRAATLEQAIALHGGEGSDAAVRFFMMPAKKRQQMISFLKTLRAPDQHATAN